MTDSNRRKHLRLWKNCLQATMLLPTLSACQLLREPEKKVSSQQELLENKYLVTDFNGEDVFISLDQNKNPYALSLICTHKQCTVEYKPDQEIFVCPCHKGKYSNEGQVIAGKPKRNLNRYKIKQSGDHIIILDEII